MSHRVFHTKIMSPTGRRQSFSATKTTRFEFALRAETAGITQKVVTALL